MPGKRITQHQESLYMSTRKSGKAKKQPPLKPLFLSVLSTE
ncbi:MAG: hypothetical protein PHO08_20160 [Methylococcales bacterium]|nr:hypothetical protein [Methylococcales bacterium]